MYYLIFYSMKFAVALHSRSQYHQVFWMIFFSVPKIEIRYTICSSCEQNVSNLKEMQAEDHLFDDRFLYFFCLAHLWSYISSFRRTWHTSWKNCTRYLLSFSITRHHNVPFNINLNKNVVFVNFRFQN